MVKQWQENCDLELKNVFFTSFVILHLIQNVIQKYNIRNITHGTQYIILFVFGEGLRNLKKHGEISRTSHY